MKLIIRISKEINAAIMKFVLFNFYVIFIGFAFIVKNIISWWSIKPDDRTYWLKNKPSSEKNNYLSPF